jgi:hypothetical protein
LAFGVIGGIFSVTSLILLLAPTRLLIQKGVTLKGGRNFSPLQTLRKRRPAMKVSQATKSFLDYHRMNSKKNTVRNYEYLLTQFCIQFGDREEESLSSRPTQG